MTTFERVRRRASSPLIRPVTPEVARRVPSLPLKALQVDLLCCHSSKRSIRLRAQTISVTEPAFRGTTSGPGRYARPPDRRARPVDATIVAGRRGVPPRAPSSLSAEFGPAGGPQGWERPTRDL